MMNAVVESEKRVMAQLHSMEARLSAALGVDAPQSTYVAPSPQKSQPVQKPKATQDQAPRVAVEPPKAPVTPVARAPAEIGGLDENGNPLCPPSGEWTAVPGIRSMAGIQVEKSVKDCFNKVRREATGTRWMTFKFDPSCVWVIPEAQGMATKDYKQDWLDFLDFLPESEARFAIYGFEYVETAGSYGGSVPKSKLTLFTWTPENCPIKGKMLASSSTAALKGVCKGTIDQAIHDKDDCDWKAIALELGCKLKD